MDSNHPGMQGTCDLTSNINTLSPPAKAPNAQRLSLTLLSLALSLWAIT